MNFGGSDACETEAESFKLVLVKAGEATFFGFDCATFTGVVFAELFFFYFFQNNFLKKYLGISSSGTTRETDLCGAEPARSLALS